MSRGSIPNHEDTLRSELGAHTAFHFGYHTGAVTVKVMLVLIASLILAFSIITYVMTMRAGIYRRVPLEHYALMGTAAGLSFLGVVREPSWLSITVLGVSLTCVSLLAWYVHFGAVFSRGGITLKVGQRFPKFRLPSSDGGTFDSARLDGEQSALYLFYRGHW